MGDTSKTVTKAYKASINIDPKVLQAYQGMYGDAMVSLSFDTSNYPTGLAPALAKCSNFVATNGSIRSSKRYAGENIAGHFSSSLKFVADTDAAYAVAYGSITPQTTKVSFNLMITADSQWQTDFAVALCWGPYLNVERVPTTDPNGGNFLIRVSQGVMTNAANGYNGMGEVPMAPRQSAAAFSAMIKNASEL